MTDMTLDQSTRAVRLLEQRSFELKANAHDRLETLWGNLLVVDGANQTLTVNKSLTDSPVTLDDAVIALQAFKELDKSAAKFSRSLSQSILATRIDSPTKTLHVTTVSMITCNSSCGGTY
jgi:hypothetical protein